jgi:hypothetical protein
MTREQAQVLLSELGRLDHWHQRKELSAPVVQALKGVLTGNDDVPPRP